MTGESTKDLISVLEDRIVSILEGCENRSENVKTLRKEILLSALQSDDDDKKAKKKFKKAIQSLQTTKNLITLSEDGTVQLVGKKKKSSKKDKKSKKEKKRKRDDETTNEEGDHTHKINNDDDKPTEEEHKKIKSEQQDETEDKGDKNTNSGDKNAPCKGNTMGITRLFLGNLPFAVDETGLREFLSPAIVTHIKWITDKETGRFYGSAFIEMKNSQDAAIAVTTKKDTQLMGRAIRINYAPARPGDIWPPKTTVQTGGGTSTKGGQAGGSGIKAMREKPADCVKMFIGNLSYEIDDDAITKFFASIDVEMKAVRWQHHRDSGDFKGWYVQIFKCDGNSFNYYPNFFYHTNKTNIFSLTVFRENYDFLKYSTLDLVPLWNFGIQKHVKRQEP